MKKLRLVSRLPAMLAVLLLGLAACLNPIGFNPETGALEISAEFTDVTSAVLEFSNLSKTVDVTKVTITQPEVPATLIEFNGKPKALTNKAQYVRPSDKEYHVQIDFMDNLSHVAGSGTVIVSAPIPKETYWIYIFRTTDGVVIADPTTHDIDLSDTGTPVSETDPEEGEGSVPGVVLPPNRDHMGVFVVINMTKTQSMDYAEFVAPYPENSANFKQFRIGGEPRHGDQQSIALGTGAWITTAAYTPPSGGQKLTGSKNAVVMPMNDPMSLRTNFMYFYQTVDGGYSLSPIWPPNPNDASPDQNLDPEDFLDDNQGILEVVNKSETGKVLYDIMIDSVEYKEVKLAKDDSMRFVLAAGSVSVAFRPQNQKFYGLTLPRTITAKKTNTLSYYDNLANPDELPADLGYGVGLIQINNNANAVVQQVYIVDPDDPMGAYLPIPFGGFTPPSKINYSKTARVGVIGNETFPLEDNKSYLIQVELYKTSGVYYAEYYRIIKNELVVVTIGEADLPENKSYGSKVTIRNKVAATAAPVSITGMQVWNASSPNQKSYISAAMWDSAGNILNGKDASIYVVSTPGMPIVQDATYRADLFVTGNGRTAVITKDFADDGKLYSNAPDTHTRELVIAESDVPAELIPVFNPVTNIAGIPAEVTSMVMQNSSTLVGPGWINLNAAEVVPDNAADKQIAWSKSGSNQNSYKIENGMLIVTEGKASGQTTAIQIRATIAKGKGNWATPTAYTQDFNITLKYTAAVPESKLATSLAKANSANMTMYVGDTRSLLGQVTINPEAATKEGTPITVSNLTFSVSGTAASLADTSKIIGTSVGTVTVTATLPAQYCANNTALTTTFIVEVKEAGPAHIPIQSITGVAGTVDSKVVSINGAYQLVAPGWLNLNDSGMGGVIVNPADAFTKQITWSVTSDTGNYIDAARLTKEGILVVQKAGTPGATQNVKVRGKIIGGGATAAQDFTSAEFTITLTFSMAEQSTYKATSLASTGMSIYVGQEMSLLGRVTINPSGAVLNGQPITVNDLTYSIVSGGTSAAITGTTIKGLATGTAKVRATLAANYTNNNSNLTTDFDVSVSVLQASDPHVAVSGIAGTVASAIDSSVMQKDGVWTLISPGWINLNTVTVSPSNATYKGIKWSLVSGANDSYVDKTVLESQGILKVSKAAPAGTGGISVKVRGTIEKGGATASSNYTTSDYTVTLTFSDISSGGKVKQLQSDNGMKMGYPDTQSLLGHFWFSPNRNPSYNGVPLTPAHLTYTVDDTSKATIDTNAFTITSLKPNVEVWVTARLKGMYTESGSDATTTFRVEIGSGAKNIDVTGLNYSAKTIESTVLPGTSTLVTPGWYNLNSIPVQPSTASKTSIVWTATSNADYLDSAQLANGILLVKKGDVNGRTVNVSLQAKIAGGANSGGGDYTATITVTLKFSDWGQNYTKPVTGLTLAGGSTMKVYEMDSKSLLGMVKLSPDGTYLNGVPITTNDLEWETGSGDGKATISGSTIAGVSAGSIQVRAKLSAAKSGGGAILYSPWITVTVDKLPSVSRQSKATFWFLFLALNDGIVFVPCDTNDFSDAERATGITNRTWASSDDDFNKATFIKKHPSAIFGGRSTNMGYTPGMAFEGEPRPMMYPDSGRYYVFFQKQEPGKSDMRIYGNGPNTAAGNKLFLLDLNSKDPSVVLNNESGVSVNSAMYTDQIVWDQNASQVTESIAKIEEKRSVYYNKLGIPFGIYRLRYWNNTISFQKAELFN